MSKKQQISGLKRTPQGRPELTSQCLQVRSRYCATGLTDILYQTRRQTNGAVVQFMCVELHKHQFSKAPFSARKVDTVPVSTEVSPIVLERVLPFVSAADCQPTMHEHSR